MKKQTELSIYSQYPLGNALKDKRYRTFEFSFGNIEEIAKQYGIKIEKLENCYKFSAPKARLQLFIEKLHFSAIPYSFKPK